MLSPLRTTSHIVLEDILLSLHSHAIDNEHNALVPWTYNLFDCRQLLPLTSRLVASMSGLAFNHHSVYTLRLCTLEDTITVHTVASLRPLRGLRFCFPTHLDRVIVITSHLSLSALPHNTTPLKRRTLLAVFMANELSYEAAASTNTQRTPCFRCFLQDVRLTSIRE